MSRDQPDLGGGPRVPTELIVPADAAGVRLDVWLARSLGVGRRAAARLAHRARLNGRRASKDTAVAAGDRVRIDPGERLPAALEEGDLLVRCTDDVLVLNKPSGLPTVSLAGDEKPTLAAWIAARHPESSALGKSGESGLVHRLDTDTSGLLLAARHARSYDDLREQFRRHEVEKTYLAVVSGAVVGRLVCEAPIGRHPKSRRRMRVVPASPGGARYAAQPARSVVEPLRALRGATLVAVHTRTGVRHQVRVHLAAAGHPLLGDSLYGGPPHPGGAGHLLHASALIWRDPHGRREEARCEAPPTWRAVLESLGSR